MSGFVAFFLFFHVLGAIVGLGPTFIFSVIGGMGGKEPQHANFATRVSEKIGDRVVEPALLSMPLTGIGLIWSAQIDLFSREARWLLAGIVVYLIAISFALLVQRNNVKRVIALSGGYPGAPDALAAGAVSAGPGAMGVPPAELPAAVQAVQRGGMFLGVTALLIVFLMVVKPSLGF